MSVHPPLPRPCGISAQGLHSAASASKASTGTQLRRRRITRQATPPPRRETPEAHRGPSSDEPRGGYGLADHGSRKIQEARRSRAALSHPLVTSNPPLASGAARAVTGVSARAPKRRSSAGGSLLALDVLRSVPLGRPFSRRGLRTPTARALGGERLGVAESHPQVTDADCVLRAFEGLYFETGCASASSAAGWRLARAASSES